MDNDDWDTGTLTPVRENSGAGQERPEDGGDLKQVLLSPGARTESLILPRPRFSRRTPPCLDESGAFFRADLSGDVPPVSPTWGTD